MAARKYKQLAHRAIAGSMAIWLSGVAFLFCCQRINGKTPEMGHCPMAKMSGHCDRAAKPNANSSVIETTDDDRAGGCAYLPVVFDRSRKIERVQKQAAVEPKLAVVPIALPDPLNHTPSITTFYGRLPDLQRTFVKNCVFRI